MLQQICQITGAISEPLPPLGKIQLRKNYTITEKKYGG